MYSPAGAGQAVETVFIPEEGRNLFALDIDPHSGEVYLSDAVDYAQRGMIYRYRTDGTLRSNFHAGIIPGSVFRREGRPSDEAILTCRLIDRPLRPSFAEGYRNETQIPCAGQHAVSIHAGGQQ